MNLFQHQHHLRPATFEDIPVLQAFLKKSIYLHKHLDWRSPLDWIGQQPFWLAEKNNQISGILASPADPPMAAWIRIFAADLFTSPTRIMAELLDKNLEWHQKHSHVPFLASLGLSEWYIHILHDLKFIHYQDIVMMVFDQNSVSYEPPKETSLIHREMKLEDLDAVAEVDNASFDPLWQLSLPDLYFAFHKSTYKTVLELEGKIVAYQMSTESECKAHLSRLAVLPEMQNRGLGSQLVRELLHYLIVQKGLKNVTLNTQSTNSASLHVYQRCGFRLTGEQYPVFIYPL